jgi:hypothetical protein
MEGGKWLTSRPGRFTQKKKDPGPIVQRLGGPQGWSGPVRKTPPPPPSREDSRTVVPVANRYTDCAIPAHKFRNNNNNNNNNTDQEHQAVTRPQTKRKECIFYWPVFVSDKRSDIWPVIKTNIFYSRIQVTVFKYWKRSGGGNDFIYFEELRHVSRVCVTAKEREGKLMARAKHDETKRDNDCGRPVPRLCKSTRR